MPASNRQPLSSPNLALWPFPSLAIFPRAFTLIELIVVIIILTVAASLIVPRLVATPGRGAERNALALAELLSAVGTRDALTSENLAIAFDPRKKTAALQTLRTRGQTLDWNARSEWAADSLVPAVTLDDAEILNVAADGITVDPSSWRIEFRPGTPRPAVRVVVAQKGASKAWRIDLPRGSMRAIVTPTTRGNNEPPLDPLTVDLDATGKEIQPW